MSIQIFGKPKCFETKKAERFFKERNIPFQRIALESKGISRGELLSVKSAVGGFEVLLDDSAKETLLIRHLAQEQQKEDKLLETPCALRTPIVRNGKQATVGYCPEIWEQWRNT